MTVICLKSPHLSLLALTRCSDSPVKSFCTFFSSLPHLLLSPWGNIQITTALVAFEQLRGLGSAASSLHPEPSTDHLAALAWPRAAASPTSLWASEGCPALETGAQRWPCALVPLCNPDFTWLDPGQRTDTASCPAEGIQWSW